MILPSAANNTKLAQTDQESQGRDQGQVKGPQSLHPEIAFLDTMLAKWLLLVELFQIPEFTTLWAQARKIPSEVMEAIKPRMEGMEEIFASLSPEARGAFLMPEKACELYDENAINEAAAADVEFSLLAGAVNEALQKLDYRSLLETIVTPLGVPDLADYLMIIDMREWGVDRILAGPISGPARDLLESMLIRGLTDLSAIEAAFEKPAQLKQRIVQKLSPLSIHLNKYNLQKRIQLWVRNVVYGESIASIANEFQNDAKRADTREPGDWIKRQIREASMILEVKRPPGRPRKGGVLRHWKLMVN